jgi:predicted nucleic acid-binding protein
LPTKEGQEQILVNYKIKTPDAIVAATAMVHGFNLVTQNE